MAKQGIDLKHEMAKKLKEIEEQFLKEKEEANQAFQQERKKYEDRIESLQKQVMEQSVTMSMISSFTPDDFQNDEDVFGRKAIRLFKKLQGVSSGRGPGMGCLRFEQGDFNF